MAQQQVCYFDVTIPYSISKSPDPILKFCKENCRDWAFQLEQGEKTGYLHYQCRFRLKARTRAQTLAGRLIQAGLGGNHVTPTHDTGNNFYVMKEDTRLEGPWTSEEEAKKIVIPRDIQCISQLRPYQQSIIDMAKNLHNYRIVDVIVDEKGNSGKTTLARYMMCHGLGEIIPFCNDFKEMMQMVMCMPTSSAYLIDMPRAISKDRLHQLYSAIELLKGGFVFDTRYKYQRKIFDPPNVFVFTNKMPDQTLLTKDRWRIWSVAPDYKLLPYIEESNGFDEAISYEDIKQHVVPKEVEPYDDLDDVIGSEVPPRQELQDNIIIDVNKGFNNLCAF